MNNNSNNHLEEFNAYVARKKRRKMTEGGGD